MEEDFKNDFVDTLMEEAFVLPAPSFADVMDVVSERNQVTALSPEQFYDMLRCGLQIRNKIADNFSKGD